MSIPRASELPELKRWASGFGLMPSSRDFLIANVSIGSLASVMELLWPRFLVQCDCVILEWAGNQDNTAQWHARLGGDCSAVEKVVNHVHLWDLFAPEDTEGAEDSSTLEEAFLASMLEVLAKTWITSANDQFPDRTFEVGCSNDDSDYGPTITIWCVSPAESTA